MAGLLTTGAAAAASLIREAGRAESKEGKGNFTHPLIWGKLPLPLRVGRDGLGARR
jgi:hypothetical protein